MPSILTLFITFSKTDLIDSAAPWILRSLPSLRVTKITQSVQAESPASRLASIKVIEGGSRKGDRIKWLYNSTKSGGRLAGKVEMSVESLEYSIDVDRLRRLSMVWLGAQRRMRLWMMAWVDVGRDR